MALEPITWNYTATDQADTTAGQPWHRGATKRDVFIFADTGATAPDWLPRKDFTGCEVRMEVRTKGDSSGTLLISLSEEPSDDGQLTLGGADGTIAFFVSRIGIMKLAGRVAFYDIFLEWPGTDVDKVVKGQISIDPNVTEPTYD